jgi:glycyl-tRNA synthetase
MKMEELVRYAKTYGFIFQGSEIYGGLANTWDYGPLGVELKNNIKQLWWRFFVQQIPNSYGVDAAILMNPKVWVASGHVSSFNDPLIDCKYCHNRFRADTLIEDATGQDADGLTHEQLSQTIKDHGIACPKCGKKEFTPIRQFNLMFETYRGVTEDKQTLYLRPETAQGEYTNFMNVQRSMRAKLPMGIGQIGKAFRNEITPGNFTFRTIEFEQMEYQYFCHEADAMAAYEMLQQRAFDYFLAMGIQEDHLQYHEHTKLAHYAKAAVDIQYLYPMGFGEVNGTHHRGTFDLTQHEQHSGETLQYRDPITNDVFTPTVVESTVGADRATLMVLHEHYAVETLGDDTREVLRLPYVLAPFKAAIFPLIKKHHTDQALSVYQLCTSFIRCEYDDTGNIGKRYRRQDAIGTPYCITIDDQTLTDHTVTIRERDAMTQSRIPMTELKEFFQSQT